MGFAETKPERKRRLKRSLTTDSTCPTTDGRDLEVWEELKRKLRARDALLETLLQKGKLAMNETRIRPPHAKNRTLGSRRSARGGRTEARVEPRPSHG